jgi:hypothetical protein
VTASVEALLAIGAVGIYLLDSAMLLSANEFVLERRGNRWHLLQPMRLELATRRLVLPNPFTPFRAQLRLHWRREQPQAQKSDVAPQAAADKIGVGTLPLLAVLIPGGVWIALSMPNPMVTLGWMALGYLATLSLLGLLYWHRRSVPLTARERWVLALEVLLCIPLALNLVRKVSQSHAKFLDPVRFAAQELDVSDRTKLRTEIEATILDTLRCLEPGSPDYSTLDGLRAELAELLA